MAGSKSADEAILELAKKHPNGLTQDTIRNELPAVSAEALLDALNSLLRAKRLSLFTAGDGTPVYKELSAEESAKFKNLSNEELLVYQHIKNAGNMGIWTKDLRIRTNLAQPQVTKFLKALEGRRLIKAVKNVNNPSRKVYMLAELEPSRELTGGAWYTENQFDSEFINVLREAAYKFIEREGDTTVKDIAAYIRQRGFSKVDLRDEDIRSIVMTLVYDGRVDQTEPEAVDDPYDHYRPAVLSVPDSTPLTSVPCGVCPVFDKCHDGGVISPQTCIYYDKWLEF